MSERLGWFLIGAATGCLFMLPNTTWVKELAKEVDREVARWMAKKILREAHSGKRPRSTELRDAIRVSRWEMLVLGYNTLSDLILDYLWKGREVRKYYCRPQRLARTAEYP